MTGPALTYVGGFAIAFLGGCAAMAQQLPPPESGDKTMNVRLVNGQVEMRDARDDTPVMLPKGVPLHQPKPASNSATPAISLQEQPNGFDLKYLYDNQSQLEQELGRMRLGVFTIGQQIDFYDFRWTGDMLHPDYANWVAPGYCYPGGVYSPVAVLGNDKYWIGISFHYPYLDYKHDIRMMVVSPGGDAARGEGGRGWLYEYRLSDWGDEVGFGKMAFSGKLPPKTKREYVISVRVVDKSSAWQRTLTPYRNFFRSTYQGVHYERDARPVAAEQIASMETVKPDNPFGFDFHPTKRPDLVGWDFVTSTLNQQTGWERMMVWMPGGAYQYSRDSEWYFTTPWESNGQMQRATEADHGFPRVAGNYKMGLWWSQSLLYSRSRDDLVGMNVNNERMVRTALAELDRAVAAGATMIGLDTFYHRTVPTWMHTQWLNMMRARHPRVTFVTEPITSDLVHRLSPTFLQCWSRRFPAQSEADLYPVKGPHYLADFLLPGHEIWGAYQYLAWSQFHGRQPTLEEVEQHMQSIAEKGFVPTMLTYQNPNTRGGFNAAESWDLTVPEDLRIPREDWKGDIYGINGPLGGNLNAPDRDSGNRNGEGGSGDKALAGAGATRQNAGGGSSSSSASRNSTAGPGAAGGSSSRSASSGQGVGGVSGGTTAKAAGLTPGEVSAAIKRAREMYAKKNQNTSRNAASNQKAPASQESSQAGVPAQPDPR
ncbi:MAG: hypothetical protein JNL50_09760 [Phycisphaerae bacterium]|nr:hypothetical protein [Phycisphaerae bacterium]